MSDLGQTLILSGRNFSTIPQLPEESNIAKLDLSNNRLVDFTGMKNYQRLAQFILDNNPKLSSFKGAEPTNGMTHFSCLKTPLGNSHSINLMAVLVFGDTLKIINGQQIPRSVYRQAAAIGTAVGDYILNGWVITNVDPIRIINPETRQRKTIYCGNTAAKSPSTSPSKPDDDKPLSVYSAADSSIEQNQGKISEEQNDDKNGEIPQQGQIDVNENDANENELRDRFNSIHNEYVSGIQPNQPPVRPKSPQQRSKTAATMRNTMREKTERPISPLGSPNMPFEEERKKKEIGNIDLPPNWMNFTSTRAQSRAAYTQSQQGYHQDKNNDGNNEEVGNNQDVISGEEQQPAEPISSGSFPAEVFDNVNAES
ncbi:hypothetical protein TRFO_23817 [Tritrichomonas foetus]|uniref:Leucine Rich Repeat family protein n=1 Tax=Tritrichomonas foetus TaxID=1144522 RepID=A0A1J4K9A1_9EUKA|nr:hypothetical protein TRFO_23817 [Tritrichomonas foetus]|eukprot:OHT07795.1 hypothetical protein TRFO_23817 [Tritrichomonas foetus]